MGAQVLGWNGSSSWVDYVTGNLVAGSAQQGLTPSSTLTPSASLTPAGA